MANRKIEYKEYVKAVSVEARKNIKTGARRRYLLTVELNIKNCEGRSIAVIMSNPSRASKFQSDKSVNQVLEFAYNNNYTKVHILNLYSYYSTKPEKIKELIQKNQEHIAIGVENDTYIKSIVKEVDDIIIAWGTGIDGIEEQYESRIKDVLKLLKGKNLYYVFEDYSASLYTRHPRTWASKSANLKLQAWNSSMDLK